MLPSTRISAARSLPRQRAATANPAGSQGSSCLSVQMPFNPGFMRIPLLKTGWKSIVPPRHGQWVLPAQAVAVLCLVPAPALEEALSSPMQVERWHGAPSASPELPAHPQGSQHVPADQQMSQRISPNEACWGNKGQDTRYLYHFWLIFVDKCCKYEPRRFKRKSQSHASELICFRQHAAGLQPFTSRNIISFLCQRLTAFALLLYFYCGGNLSKNMYSELLNSTSATEAHLIIQTNTPYLSSTPRPVSSSALYMSTARVLKEGEINKPDLVTYIILFFFLFLTVTFIVFFINCQLKNSFFATLPYDRSLREARNPWRTQAVWHFSFQQEQAPETLCNKELVPCASAWMWPLLE